MEDHDAIVIEISLSELEHCDDIIGKTWTSQYAYSGGFVTSLMNAIECADSINRRKLSLIYPKLVNLFVNHNH